MKRKVFFIQTSGSGRNPYTIMRAPQCEMQLNPLIPHDPAAAVRERLKRLARLTGRLSQLHTAQFIFGHVVAHAGAVAASMAGEGRTVTKSELAS